MRLKSWDTDRRHHTALQSDKLRWFGDFSSLRGFFPAYWAAEKSICRFLGDPCYETNQTAKRGWATNACKISIFLSVVDKFSITDVIIIVIIIIIIIIWGRFAWRIWLHIPCNLSSLLYSIYAAEALQMALCTGWPNIKYTTTYLNGINSNKWYCIFGSN